MQKEISVSQAQRKFYSILDDAVLHSTHYIITVEGKPAVVLLSYGEWLRLQALKLVVEREAWLKDVAANWKPLARTRRIAKKKGL
jgi:prevent-host-death family protein